MENQNQVDNYNIKIPLHNKYELVILKDEIK